MTRAILKTTLLLAAVLISTGCSSLNKKPAGGASIENRGLSNGEMSDIDAARSKGMGDGSGAGAAELNDPKSPLSVRVIYFDYDSSDIRADFQSIVQAHAKYLSGHPQTTVTLEGHTDESGSREYNLALGERRALTVRRQLVLLGATAGQIKTVSYGEERPVAEGHDEQSYSQNRRAEIIYQQ
jgi:peptidoglycan-associated lipoprotein